MKLPSSFTLIALCMATHSGPAMAQEAPAENLAAATSQHSVSYTFQQLTGPSSILLRGSGSNAYVGFGSRLDQVITGGTLHLEFVPSPSLLANVSHLRVYLNNELMDVVSLSSKTLGQRLQRDIALDGRFFQNYNQLRFEFSGRLDADCSSPLDPAIWWDLSSASRITLRTEPLTLANELSLLPAPFLDERDFRDTAIPMVIPAQFDQQALHSTAVVASYFSSRAKWRKIRYPVYQTTLPKRSAVVFATNQHRPTALAYLPEIERPMIQMVSHPEVAGAKLLLILGKDEQQLALAARALAAGNQLLSGAVAYVDQFKELAQRRPYDAPNWIATDRAVRFGELVSDLQQLQTQGVSLGPIFMDFNLPPDLFTWNANSIPMKLSYRYSPPEEGTHASRLNVSINNGFVRAFPLDSEGSSNQQQVWRVPILGSEAFAQDEWVAVPGFKTQVANQLRFDFQLTQRATGICSGSTPTTQYAAIDRDSTLDFSGFPHYLRMPNNHVFADSAFPYSRMADLSETALVMSAKPSVEEVETLLSLVGFIAAKTGLPAYRFSLHDHWDNQALQDRDVLVLGVQAASRFGLTADSLTYVNSSQSGQTLQATALPEKEVVTGLTDSQGPVPTMQTELSSRGQFASIASFESPLSRQRTVTVLSGRNDASLSLLLRALVDNPGQISGSAVAITPMGITSYQIGQYYYLGKLPLYDLVWYHFSDRPLLMVAVALLLVLVVTLLIWRVLSRYAKRRLSFNRGDEQ